MAKIDDVFIPALDGKQLPLLPLDHKWYQLLSGLEKSKHMLEIEEQCKELLKRQGKLNTDCKAMRKKKSALMEEIVRSMDQESMEQFQIDKKQEIEQLNRLYDSYQEELLDLPKQIQELNQELMLETMQMCYSILQENTAEIDAISDWISETRIELKRKIVIRQEKEMRNQIMYSYMHDIFGPEVIDIFDLKYNPETEHIVVENTTNESN